MTATKLTKGTKSGAHTPTPWRATKDHTGIVSEQEGRVADIVLNHEPSLNQPQTFHDGRQRANAEFIVLACNAHDDLRIACQRAESFLSELQRHLPDLRAVHCANVLETVRAAIAKAEGR